MYVISFDSSIPRITFPNVFANQNEMKKSRAQTVEHDRIKNSGNVLFAHGALGLLHAGSDVMTE